MEGARRDRDACGQGRHEHGQEAPEAGHRIACLGPDRGPFDSFFPKMVSASGSRIDSLWFL